MAVLHAVCLLPTDMVVTLFCSMLLLMVLYVARYVLAATSCNAFIHHIQSMLAASIHQRNHVCSLQVNARLLKELQQQHTADSHFHAIMLRQAWSAWRLGSQLMQQEHVQQKQRQQTWAKVDRWLTEIQQTRRCASKTER